MIYIYTANTKKAEIVFNAYVNKKHPSQESIKVISHAPLKIEVKPSISFIKKQSIKAMRREGLNKKDFGFEVLF